MDTINRNHSQANNTKAVEVFKKVPLTREDVLKAAARLIRVHGYHGTSTQMIADELGISKSTFFHHAKSKQDMLFEIINAPLQQLYPNIQEIYKRQLSPRQKLELALNNHIVNIVENLEVVAVLLQERDCLKPPYSEILEPVRDGYLRIIRRIIEDGVISGDFRQLNPKVTTYAILGMCNWLVQWYNPEGAVTPKAIAETYTNYALQIVLP